MRTLLPPLALALSACGSSPNTVDQTGPSTPPISVPGSTAEIQTTPFQVCFGDTVCTSTPSAVPSPQPYLYAEGPRPVINPSTIAAFPAFGWVVGTTDNQVIPQQIWQGNRLSGRDQGTLYEVTGVAEVRELPDRIEVDLTTNYSEPTPALLTIRAHPSGATEMTLTPPAAMIAEGIAVTLFTIDSPTDEGLFGMGARKDFFNQRGKLRNVWTEQQNTGLGSLDELDLAGAGNFAGANGLQNPTAEFTDSIGLNPDVDDAALAEERTTFPNGAQAAYWVEAYVVGSRGWAVWTTNKHFQRLDLGATLPDKLRWQVVDADEVTIVFADGTQVASSHIEEASRIYTEYWGRAQKPTIQSWEPWIDTLNQGEGEAAPNGQGFWGGQRARCEIEEFIAKSTTYDIPFTLIGVEGWQVIPQLHPQCTRLTTEEICGHANGFPRTEEEWQAEVTAGTSFFNRPEAACAAEYANASFFDYVRQQGFDITGYWNFFTTDHNCPDNDPNQCVDDQLGVPLASKQAYAVAFNQDIFVKSADDPSSNHTVTTNRGGISSLVDFTDDAAIPFWKSQLARSFDEDITIFMHDFGELTSYDMAWDTDNCENLTECHNLFAFNYQRAARIAIGEYAQEHNKGADFAPYYFARAGMTGSCSFTPGVFPGDESTNWDQGHGLPSVVPAMLNLALSGCYAFTTDIGGYWDFTAPRTDEDLFIRWSQLAALTPVMRIHSSTFNGSVFPWTWTEGDHADAETYDAPAIFSRYAKLKVNLIPLVDHWAQRAANEGVIGPVRPIILEDDSAEAMAVDYQWLLGHDLLAAPTVFEDVSTQEVYFPSGANWRRVTVNINGQLLASNEIYSGGQTATVNLDSELNDIPLFVRCGAENPLLPVADSNVTACTLP